MSRFEIKFELTQHTPIIHFQGDQAGATLRATELKPKLDTFLHKKFEREGKKIVESWKVSKLHPALDYKVKVETQRVSFTEINKNHPTQMFFGNIGEEEPSKHLSMTNEPIKIIFKSFNVAILNEIKICFKEFIFRTNFGTRQSKGYGSFYIKDSLPQEFHNTPYLYFFQNAPGRYQYSKVLDVINFHYQRLKSGINFRGVYFHSFLKEFLFANKNYSWEKRWLKEKFIGGLDPNDRPEKFARIFLGYNSSYTFKKTPPNPREGEVYPERNTDVTIFHESDEISRYKSPITYKPIFVGNEWTIFIILEEINPDILDKNFQFYRNKISAADRQFKSPFNRRTPNESIDLKNLIDSYHLELGKKWKAYTFNGQEIGVLNSGKL